MCNFVQIYIKIIYIIRDKLNDLPSMALEQQDRILPHEKMNERRILSNALECRHYLRRETLYECGDECTHISFVMSGKIKMFKQGVISKFLILKIAQPGVLGHQAFLCDTSFQKCQY